MSAYSLTFEESWTLAALLRLPVQPGSALAGWLDSKDSSKIDIPSNSALQSLAFKGYYSPSRLDQPFPSGLIESLTLASVNACELTAVIRTGDKAGLTRFAQVGSGILQFGADEEKLTLHDVTQMRELAQILLPGWFTVQENENLWCDLSLGAFLLFKQACAVSDWAAARSGFDGGQFSRTDLKETFERTAGWVDVFHAVGVRGTPELAQIPFEETLKGLVTRGFLEEAGGEALATGAAGKPLAAAFSDPGLCILTLNLQMWGEKDSPSGAFLYGGGRLFLAEFTPDRVAIHQLAGLDAGRFWVENLLGKGSQARYATYTLPGVPAAPVKVPEPAAPAVTPPAIPPAPHAAVHPAPLVTPPEAPPAPKLVWYYMLNGKQCGPVDEADLRTWLAQGRLRPETYVWNQTWKDWKRAYQAGLVAPRAQAGRVCPRCRRALAPGTRICPYCGTRL